MKSLRLYTCMCISWEISIHVCADKNYNSWKLRTIQVELYFGWKCDQQIKAVFYDLFDGNFLKNEEVHICILVICFLVWYLLCLVELGSPQSNMLIAWNEKQAPQSLSYEDIMPCSQQIIFW